MVIMLYPEAYSICMIYDLLLLYLCVYALYNIMQFDNRFDDVGVSLSGLDTTEKKESKSTSFFFALHTRTMRMMTTGCLFLFVFKRVVIDWVRVVM